MNSENQARIVVIENNVIEIYSLVVLMKIIAEPTENI
tara:strand:- start:2560 stop:2670 length:111 start_codon:yes stop_codon:yes gene_type:complete